MAKRKEIKVQDITVSWQVINDEDYISLTDIARKYNEKTDVVLQSWMRNGSTVEFLGLWEQLQNPNFNPHGFAGIKNRVGFNNFYLSVKEWVKETNAIGIQARTGRYGGTFAHKDIVFEFASWIDVKFKLYLILEFQRLKEAEANQQQIEWNANRFLTKRNYSLQTEAVKQVLLPQSTYKTEDQWIEYASEADILNGALFGTTAKQWRESHPEEAKRGENIRDYATNIQLIVLSNLEAINAELIRDGIAKEERYLRLQQAALFQLGIYYRDQQLIDNTLGE